jgi:hypothetical protein
VEEPVRRGALKRAWQRLRSGRLAVGLPRVAAATTAAGVLAIACTGMAGVGGIPAASGAAALTGGGSLSAATNSVTRVGKPAPGKPGSRACRAAARSRAPGCAAASRSATASPSPSVQQQADLRTSCTSVAHLGDSTSDGLISPDYLPNPKDRIQARYEEVGARTVYTDITGARSVVETLPGTTNAAQAAQSLIKRGFNGCWVIALGTNDTADVQVGSNVGLAARIKEMMQVTRGQPVMWVNVVSLLSSGPYAERNMEKWNEALLQACVRYPNMRVFNWAPLAARGWFISDGIHYTSPGYQKRSLYIADGLAEAFPQTGPSQGCLISLPNSVTAPAPAPSAQPSATGSGLSSPSAGAASPGMPSRPTPVAAGSP